MTRLCRPLKIIYQRSRYASIRLSQSRQNSRRLQHPAIKRRGDEFEVANCDFKFGRGRSTRTPLSFYRTRRLNGRHCLRSSRAITMAIYVVRAFIKQRETVATNATILKRLAEVDKTCSNTTRLCGFSGSACNPCLHLHSIDPAKELDSTRAIAEGWR